mgnify:CR=1 FL=1
MTVKVRSYEWPKDFDRVSNFLVDIYNPDKEYRYKNWLQPRWEYMHYHPNLKKENLDRIGIWEDSGKIVAVVNYEDKLGDAFFSVHSNYTYLKKEMLDYAEENLYREMPNNRKYLRVFINDFDHELKKLAKEKGFKKDEHHEEYRYISKFDIKFPFPEISLPEGFVVKGLIKDEVLYKVKRVLWRGFNHSGEPDDDLEGRKLMQSAPNWQGELNLVVEAPDGSFVSYCGMWYDSVNKISYVEPVATVPPYRRMGLGRAAVLEGIRRCGKLGATVAFVETGLPFYMGIGFERIFSRYPWEKAY